MASPVGNTASCKIIEEGFFIPPSSWIDVRMGYEGDFVSDGKMKQKIQGHGRVDTYQQDTNSGTITLNAVKRLDAYALFGSSKTKASWRFTDTTDAIHNTQMETRYDFLWAVGARAIAIEWGGCCLGFGGRYTACNYNVAWLNVDGVSSATQGARCQWHEWQVNGDFSFHIDLFTPYLGVKYSRAHTKVGSFPVAISQSGSGINQFVSRNPVGVYIGCALSTGKYFMLNIEGRLVDEEALTLSADIAF
ncbi:MAG: major outer membrane protein [Chlamydiota bacterium]|jgi:hypothetical protein